MEGYCLKCRTKREMKGATQVTLKNGRPASQGTCPVCGTKITVIGKSGKEYRKRIIIEGEKTAFKFNIPEIPKDIVFNKYGESLAYDIKVNPAS